VWWHHNSSEDNEMMEPTIGWWEKLFGLAVLPAVWIGSIEWRIRDKVSKDRFGDLHDQVNRIEGNQYRLLEHLKVPGIIEPPEEIKNNGKS